MKKYSLILAVGFSLLLTEGKCVDQKYMEYLKQYPTTLGSYGNYKNGEIKIILDEAKIEEVEALTNRKAGVVAEDRYWIWLNDVVRFPKGNYGVYGRILWRGSLKGIPGVAVMPVLPNGKVALNRNFRHATRSWECELPRGGVDPGKNASEAAFRELKEETGYIVEELELLGYMHPDTGITNTIVPVYRGVVVKEGRAELEDSEAIEAVEAFSVEELKKGFLQGYPETTIDGELVKVSLRDPFLAFALFQSDLRS